MAKPTAPARALSPEGADDPALRPRNLDEYIGQAAVVDNLRVYLRAAKQLSDGFSFAEDLFHRAPPIRSPSSSPSASFSMAMMSALISSSVRRGCGL